LETKFIIYQLFVRLFGNTQPTTIPNGSRNENGSGTFNDINQKAIQSIKDLGIDHIWLTGILRHATQSDHSSLGLPNSHPATVKGKAGSPYAITDFFDLSPDLSDKPENRCS
jgi:glycosidase